MKRLLCSILSAIMLAAAALSSSAFTLQSSRTYKSADDSGAYVIDFSGSHVDISRYASDTFSVGLNLSYNVSGVCAYHGKVVMFSDDTDNNQMIVYVYDLDSDMIDSFTLYGVKLYGDTDFCCDDNAIYIENPKDNRELTVYSYIGDLIRKNRFDQRITALCSGYRSGVYAVSGSTLYGLSGSSFTSIGGIDGDSSLFPASSDILVSDNGNVYVMNGNRISRSFTVDHHFDTASACVIGNRLYYPYGSVIYGYDISDGSKESSYCLSFDASLLYTDGGSLIAVGDSLYSSVNTKDFTELNKPDDSNRSENKNGSSGSNRSDANHNADAGPSKISSNVYRVDYGNYYITGISSETTVAQFKSNMNYNGWSVALYRDGSLKTSGSVGTAMTAVFTSGGSSVTFELSVIGDITGEGNCNSRDVNVLLDYLIGAADFNGVYYLAADLSGDGNVDAVDAALLKRKE